MTEKTPIIAMLEAYDKRRTDRWHMPGHKGEFPPLSGAWDVTEVQGTDNLHHPTEGIAQAQRLLARAAGAAHSHLLVGGSSAGLHAMLAMLAPGDGIILSRWVHKAVVNAAQLYGLAPCWVQPAWDGTEQLPEDQPEALVAAMERNPQAKAILVTTPDYYGRCLPLEAISRCAHRLGMLVLVDSAHGAHFPFSPLLPPSPAAWADLWVASAHTTLGALTQSAWLHASARVPEDQLMRSLAWVQSSSPSYWLMASLDQARAQAERADWAGLIERCEAFRRNAGKLDGIQMFPSDDPTRLVIDVANRVGSGLAAARLLSEGGVELEMADSRRLVAIATPWDRPEKFDRLASALARLPQREAAMELPPLPEPGERAAPLSCARGPRRAIELACAAGEIAADAAGAYPPGIALWQPGERITPAQVAYLQALEAQGAEIFGIYDGKVEVANGLSFGDF